MKERHHSQLLKVFFLTHNAQIYIERDRERERQRERDREMQRGRASNALYA